MAGLLGTLKTTVNKSMAPIGIKIVRTDGHDWSDTANFIPFQGTIDSAQAAGLSVADYVDNVMNGVPGSSQATIDKLASTGMFAQPMQTVVEIGPGTGRYLAKAMKAANPQRYEIYETARPWAAYLAREYNVVLQPTDGYAMAATPDRSADLVHAHKVFSGVPFTVSISYFAEMARVIRPGGFAAFDVMTERCLEGSQIETWVKSNSRNGAYPAVMPRDLVTNFFSDRGFALVQSFIVPMPPGTTELIVFQRQHA